MDREFMSEYYDRIYDELMTARDGHEDPEYQKVSRETAEAEKKLKELCGGINSELWEAYEKCIDSKAEEYGFLLRAVYLAGAEDRERMLK